MSYSLNGEGGSSVLLGLAQNVFDAGGGDRAAAELLRDNYGIANPAWLADYTAKPELSIKLLYTEAGDKFLVYQNFDGGAWRDNSSATGVVGATGAAGATGNSYFFASLAARDTFFGTSPNETLLKTDLPITTNVGNKTAATFVWTGVDSPVTYDPDSWRTASIEASSGTLFLGESGAAINSGNEVLGFISPSGHKHYFHGIEYDDSGSETPLYWVLGVASSVVVADVFDTQLSDPQDFTLPTSIDSMTSAFSIKPATIGDLRVQAWLGTDDTGPVIYDEDYLIEVGDLGTIKELVLVNDFLATAGLNVHIRFSGTELFGGLQTSGVLTGQTVPFVEAKIQVGTPTNYASEPFVDTRTFYGMNGEWDGNRTAKANNSGTLTLQAYDATASDFLDSSFLFIDENEIVLQKQIGDGAGSVVTASSIVIDDTKMQIQDGTNLKGLVYQVDYSANFTDRSLVDLGTVETLIAPTVALAKNIQTTGLTSGCLITPTSPTTLDITAGTGYVADFTDPTNPIITLAPFNGVTGYVPVGPADGTYQLAFNQNDPDTVIELLFPVSNQQRRDNIIFGGIGLTSLQITAFEPAPVNLGYDGLQTSKDFISDVIGPATVSGNTITGSLTETSPPNKKGLANSGGKIFVLGANFRNNPEVPDEVAIPTEPDMSFVKSFLTASHADVIFVAPSFELDATQFDNGTGSLSAVAANDHTVQVVYISASGLYGVAYGQEVFNTQAGAEQSLLDGTLTYIEPPILAAFVRRTFIIVRGNLTDVSDTSQFKEFQEGKFRGGGLSLSGGIAGINTPGGASNDIQFNSAGTFGGDSDFTWDNASKILQAIGTQVITDGGTNVYPAPSNHGRNLLIKSDGETGLTIYANNTNVSCVCFGDQDDSDVASFRYDHGNNRLYVRQGGNDLWFFRNDGAFVKNAGNGIIWSTVDGSNFIRLGAIGDTREWEMRSGNPAIAGSGGFEHFVRNGSLALENILSVKHAGINATRNISTTGTLAGTRLNDLRIAADSQGIDANFNVGGGLPLSITSGLKNIGMGHLANLNLTSGSSNIAIGHEPLVNNFTGNNNVAIGDDTLHDFKNSDSIALGSGAMSKRVNGSFNIAIGTNSQSDGSSIPSGVKNISLGSNSMATITTGLSNIGIGDSTLGSITTGNNNTIVGNSSATSLSTAIQNTIVGNEAGNNLTTGNQHIAIGDEAEAGTSGGQNTVVGVRAGATLGNSFNNLILGFQADVVNATSLNNIIIGQNAMGSTGVPNDYLNIGGVIQGDLANNNLRISGDPNAVFNTSAGLELADPFKVLLHARPSTVEENGLTKLNGMMWYNATTEEMRGFINGAVHVFTTTLAA